MPSCPGNWWKYASTGKCYYQSTVQADFETARKICRFIANGGDLARVTAEETALVLTADFWRNSPSDRGTRSILNNPCMHVYACVCMYVCMYVCMHIS